MKENKLFDILYIANEDARTVLHDQQWAATKAEAVKLSRLEYGTHIYIISVKKHAMGLNPGE